MKKLTIRDLLANWLEILSGACFVACVALVVVNIFLRYFMKTGLYWSEEVTTSLFVWGVYLGAVVCYKRRMHVSVDLLVKRFPPKAQKITNVLVDLMLVALNVYLTVICAKYISISYTKPTAVLNISTAFISTSLLICFALTSYYAVKFLILDLRKTPEKEEANEG